MNGLQDQTSRMIDMDHADYSIHVTHYDDGTLQFVVEGVADGDDDRDAIAWALREIADMIEVGVGGMERLQ